jgi:hypothetical protein
MDWIHLAQDKVQWWDVVKTVTNPVRFYIVTLEHAVPLRHEQLTEIRERW